MLRGKLKSSSKILLACLLMVVAVNARSTSNKVDATDLPVTHVSGSLSANTTWLSGNVYYIDSVVTIPENITLTVNPGAIIKIQSGTGVNVNYGGTLNAAGTATNPITITSYRDDTYGGDSNGDGSSNGSDSDYSYAVMNYGGTVLLQNANQQFGSYAYYTDCSTAIGNLSTVADNDFKGAIYVRYCLASDLTLERNNITAASGLYPISIESADLPIVKLTGANKNTFSGSDAAATLAVYGGSVPTGSTWVIDNSGGADVVSLNNIAVKGTLSILPGSILKVGQFGAGIDVSDDGVLDAEGTTLNPIVFTGYSDDNAGGDSNMDGNSSAVDSQKYNTAVKLDGGEATISHSIFRYGSQAINVDCLNSLVNSATVHDNNFGGSVDIHDCASAVVSLLRNTFAVPTGTSDHALTLSGVSLSENISLNGADKNIFTGNDQSIVVFISGVVPSDGSWTIDPSTGATYLIQPQVSVEGILNLNAGTIIKGGPGYDIFNVHEGGTLNILGTSSSPVTLTSYRDSSIGGDSYYLGAGTADVNDYGNAIKVDSNGQASGQYVNILYAAVALNLNGGEVILQNSTIDHVSTGVSAQYGKIIYRGQIHNVSSIGIYACNWFLDCSVDAAYVDWGSVDGPYLSTGNLVCGQLTVDPWVYSGSTYTNNNIFATGACDSSDPPSTALANRVNTYIQTIDTKDIDCSNGMQDACDYITTYNACIQGAWDVAENNSPFSFPTGSPISNPTGYYTSYLDAASAYIESIEPSSVTGFTFTAGSELLSLVGTIQNLNTAYDSCLSQ